VRAHTHTHTYREAVMLDGKRRVSKHRYDNRYTHPIDGPFPKIIERYELKRKRPNDANDGKYG